MPILNWSLPCGKKSGDRSLISCMPPFFAFCFWFYNSVFSDYCLHLHGYIHNVSVDMSSGFLQEFLVELESQHWTSNHVLHLIHGVASSDSVNHNRIQKNCSRKHNQLLKNNWPPIKDIDYVTNTFDHQVYTNKKLWHVYIHIYTYQNLTLNDPYEVNLP